MDVSTVPGTSLAPAAKMMRSGRGRWLTLVQLGFLLAVMAAIVLALRGTATPPQVPEHQGPPRIDGYQLVRSQQGPAALETVSAMHRGAFTLLDAWVGYYDQGAMIWAGRAPSSAEAAAQVEAMVRTIAGGGTPFSTPRAIAWEGTPLYQTSDGRVTHYFLQRGSDVVWIAPPASNADRFVQAAFATLALTHR